MCVAFPERSAPTARPHLGDRHVCLRLQWSMESARGLNTPPPEEPSDGPARSPTGEHCPTSSSRVPATLPGPRHRARCLQGHTMSRVLLAGQHRLQLGGHSGRPGEQRLAGPAHERAGAGDRRDRAGGGWGSGPFTPARRPRAPAHGRLTRHRGAGSGVVGRAFQPAKPFAVDRSDAVRERGLGPRARNDPQDRRGSGQSPELSRRLPSTLSSAASASQSCREAEPQGGGEQPPSHLPLAPPTKEPTA